MRNSLTSYKNNFISCLNLLKIIKLRVIKSFFNYFYRLFSHIARFANSSFFSGDIKLIQDVSFSNLLYSYIPFFTQKVCRKHVFTYPNENFLDELIKTNEKALNSGIN